MPTLHEVAPDNYSRIERQGFEKSFQRQPQEIMNINSISLIMNLDTDMFLAQPIHIFTVWAQNVLRSILLEKKTI